MTRLARRVVAVLRDDSGQALIETALFAPIVVFGICAVIFFSQLGVLSERSESAIRYGNDVSYKNNNQAYSVATVYSLLDEVENPSNNELGALCLQNNPQAPAPGPTSSDASTSANETRIQKDIGDALIQAQQVPSPDPAVTPGPSAKPFYKPVSYSVPGCQPGMIRLNPANSTNNQGQSAASQNNGGLPLSTTGLSITSAVNSPHNAGSFAVGLSLFMMTDPNLTTTAHETFLNVAAPSVIAACTPIGADEISVLGGGTTLTPQQQATLAGLCPGGPSGT